MKKSVIISLLVALAATGTASAAELTSSNYNSGKYTIGGNADGANQPVRIEILNNGYVFEDLTEENASDVYFYTGFAESKSDGSFNFEIPVPESASNYSVRLSFFGGETKSTSFATYSEDQMNDAIEIYLNKTDRQEADLNSLISSYYGLLGVDYTDYKGFSSEKKTVMFTQLEKRIKNNEVKNSADLKTYIDAFFAAEEFKNEDNAADYIKANAAYFGIDTTSKAYTEWDSMEDDKKNAIAEDLKSKGCELDEISDEFVNSVVMYELKNVFWNEQPKILTKYDEYTKFSESNFSVVTNETNKKNILEAFKAKADSGELKDVSKIKDELNALIKKYNVSYGGGGNSSSSSSSSSGSSGNVSIGAAVPVIKEPTLPFDDLETVEWAKIPIIALNNNGIVNGKENKKFCPNDTLTREELAVMTARAFGLSPAGEKVFDDVDINRWSFGYITAAKNAGLISGISEKEFAPSNAITREDIAVILYRAAENVGKAPEGEAKREFSDSEEISSYAREAVNALHGAGIISGTGSNFEPKRSATRAEAAKMLYQILKHCEIIK